MGGIPQLDVEDGAEFVLLIIELLTILLNTQGGWGSGIKGKGESNV